MRLSSSELPDRNGLGQQGVATGDRRSSRQRLRSNRLWRLGGFFLGVFMLMGPFAVIVRLGSLVFSRSTAAKSVPTIHQMCLRMPIGWLVQPSSWIRLATNPLYFVSLFVLPVVAIAAAPLFCGWLCPAGALPEHLGRLVPDRFKWDIHGKVDTTPLRYGFFTGLILAPFLGLNVCCAFCNFSATQSIVSFLGGSTAAFAYFHSLAILTLLLWLGVFGLFMKGGRGWCQMLCPVGAFTSLVAGITAKLPFARRIRHDSSACNGCSKCEDSCSLRAIDPGEEGGMRVNQFLCNGCMDCVHACSTGAMRYGRPEARS